MIQFREATRDMDSVTTLNFYRNLYFSESSTTERGIMANALNDVLPLIPKVGKWYKEPLPTPQYIPEQYQPQTTPQFVEVADDEDVPF